MTIESEVCGALRAVWHLAADRCAPWPDTAGREWIATVGERARLIWVVPSVDRDRLLASLAARDALRLAGIAVGDVVPTTTGMRTAEVSLGDGVVAEMTVRLDPPGRPLDPVDPIDQQWWGDLLGRAHRELQSFRHPGLHRLRWPAADELSGIVGAVTRLTVTDQLAYGTLHTDPLATLFRIDPDTGRSALARWGLPVIGPLVYDVAIAVHHVGGLAAAAELVDGYASAGPVSRDELDAALPTMLTLVSAVWGEPGANDADRRPQG